MGKILVVDTLKTQNKSLSLIYTKTWEKSGQHFLSIYKKNKR